jgi:octopine/nopaline transport system ATP-binding protein
MHIPPNAPQPSDDTPNIAVHVAGLHKSFGTLEVLKGIDMTARDGEVVSLIGASGSGKSTFLRCLNLLERPDRGEISIAGEQIHFAAENRRPNRERARQIQAIRKRLGMVFQQFNLWPHLTVLGNVIEAPVHVLGVPKREATEQAMALLEKVGLADKYNQYPAFLSGGQQQRAGIARALAMQPQVLLFDEPTSALDPELVGEVLKVIRDLADEGRTMILVTHEMRFARDVSDQVMFLHQGQVEEAGSPEKVLDDPDSERCRQFVMAAV